MNNNKKGFSLIELMTAVFLSVVVSLFVYTMMLSAYSAYGRLVAISKNANSIRFFISSINNSVRYAKSVTGNTNELSFVVYNRNKGMEVTEKYYFSEGSEMLKNKENSISISTNTHCCNTLGVLKKDIIKDGKVLESIVVSNVIRNIYFYYENYNRFKRLDLGVIYDDVVDGVQNNTTGKIEKKANGTTEMFNENTLNRRLFSFSFRSAY